MEVDMEISEVCPSWPIKMDASGRIMVPAEARKLYGWDKDTHLVMDQTDDGSLRILTFDQFIKNVQHHFREKFADRSMVDELIAERRQEAAHEESRH